MVGQRVWAAVRPFLLAAGFVGIAALLRVWPLSYLGTELVWMTFYLAVMVSAVVGGLWAGEFAVGLSLLVVIFLGPLLVGEAFISTGPQTLGLLVFAVTASLICVVAELMRRAQARTVQAMTAKTEAESSAAALREVTAQLELAQQIAHIGSWTLDSRSGALRWSSEMYRIFGLDSEGGVPDHPQLGHPVTSEAWSQVSTAITQTQQTGVPHELELEMVRADGGHGWIFARGEVVRDETWATVGLTGVVQDISERRAASDALQVQATHDQLTGLANRASVLDEIARALSAGQRSGQAAAVLLLDLDRFKDVNDTLGHAAGDDLLIAGARRLESATRAGDLVARLGGDEFVVALRGLDDPSEATRVASRVVESFRAPFALGGVEVFATASVGVAISAEDSDASDMVREADTAMYAAKEAGRDRMAVFNEDLRSALTARLAVENDLRHALARGELSVWYQPEVDLTTGTVVAVEALLRWYHPDGTVWTADRFIDVAEETGLILDIGDWVLRQACAQSAAWAASRPDRPITMRVNASAHQLAESGLLDAIDDALTTSGLDPAQLCIEITETALLRQTTTVAANLDGIHTRGISLAIDDFGTGYASLTYLSQYPIDVLKIDRSFITDPTRAGHERQHQLLTGIVALAVALGITVTAEGVELPEQADHLREMGCPTAQGWLYSKAVPAEDVTPLLDHVGPWPRLHGSAPESIHAE